MDEQFVVLFCDDRLVIRYDLRRDDAPLRISRVHVLVAVVFVLMVAVVEDVVRPAVARNDGRVPYVGFVRFCEGVEHPFRGHASDGPHRADVVETRRRCLAQTVHAGGVKHDEEIPVAFEDVGADRAARSEGVPGREPNVGVVQGVIAERTQAVVADDVDPFSYGNSHILAGIPGVAI